MVIDQGIPYVFPSHFARRFANGEFFLPEGEDLPHLVIATEKLAHGDWKTQSVRSEFMGMEEGESGLLQNVWNNFYGSWARVEKTNGAICDVEPWKLNFYPATVTAHRHKLTGFNLLRKHGVVSVSEGIYREMVNVFQDLDGCHSLKILKIIEGPGVDDIEVEYVLIKEGVANIEEQR